MLGAGGCERDVGLCVKNGGHGHNCCGHSGKREVQKLVEDQHSLLDNLKTDRSLI